MHRTGPRCRGWPALVRRSRARAVWPRRSPRLGQDAEAAVPAVEVGDGGGQVVAVEVRPQPGREEELGVRALPQEEIAEPLLTAGADQQIHVRGPAALQLTEPACEGLARGL